MKPGRQAPQDDSSHRSLQGIGPRQRKPERFRAKWRTRAGGCWAAIKQSCDRSRRSWSWCATARAWRKQAKRRCGGSCASDIDYCRFIVGGYQRSRRQNAVHPPCIGSTCFAPNRRHWHPEHHARVGHGTNPRNWRPIGCRSPATRHSSTILVRGRWGGVGSWGRE